MRKPAMGNARPAAIVGLAGLVLLGLPLSGFAEGRCPAGMFETGSRDFIACAPIPGYGEGGEEEQQETIQMVWADRWGAYATEKGASGLGVANGRASKAAAEKDAVLDCRQVAKEPSKCSVQLSFYNQCAAYAWGGGHGVAASAVNEKAAIREATKLCDEASGVECLIYHSGCSFQEAVPP
ncbi:DUF4189 domain-containing protein [Lysobacter sp. Root604]|uniref:DUF4189 domain-containing protein n=2 Tax=unclassified Lysobacter TaxID=2635362 RepID=UPI0009E9CCB1|nr:DUF4189 domain-containing protein [Lysobacter sp. Root604]